MRGRMGRPRNIKTPQAFDRLADKYFDQCKLEKRRPTLTGLILALGLSSRQSLDEYLNYEGFSDSVKRAKLRIEAEYEERLGENNPAGAIFALKNFGWTDRREVEYSGSIGIVMGSQACEEAALKARNRLEEIRAARRKDDPAA